MLGERSAYDLAFLPQPFLPTEALERGLPRVRRALRTPIVVDGRNLYEPARMRALGFLHAGIGRKVT